MLRDELLLVDRRWVTPLTTAGADCYERSDGKNCEPERVNGAILHY